MKTCFTRSSRKFKLVKLTDQETGSAKWHFSKIRNHLLSRIPYDSGKQRMDLEMIVLASSREPRLNQVHLKNYDCKTWTVLLSNAVVVYRTLPGQTSDDHIQRLRRRIFCEDMDGCPLNSLGLNGNNTDLGTENLLKIPRYGKRMKDIKKTVWACNLRKSLPSFTTVLPLAFNTLS